VILEHAPVSVIPGREQQFEAAFAEAKAIISPAPGSRSVTRSRCVDPPNACLLLVWDRLADHTGSAGLPRTTSGVARCTTSTTRSRW
jgi:heme-degrading monooxygenase HmoA